MAKGGFLAEMLASKNTSTDTGFLLKFIYYAYFAIPIATAYWFFLTSVLVGLAIMAIAPMLGFLVSSDVLESNRAISASIAFIISILVTTLLYHLGLLPTLLAPVKMLLNL